MNVEHILTIEITSSAKEPLCPSNIIIVLSTHDEELTKNQLVQKLHKFKSKMKDSGKVTIAIAKSFAEEEHYNFVINQDRIYESDFDNMIHEIQEQGEEISRIYDNFKNEINFSDVDTVLVLKDILYQKYRTA